MEAGQSQGTSICKNLIEYSEPSEQQPDASSLPPHLRETNRPSRAQREREPYNLRPKKHWRR